MKRRHNEDALRVEDTLGLYCLADGMGGHAGGEVASAMALEELVQFFERTPAAAHASAEQHPLAAATKLASRRIFDAAAANPELQGMGTTLVAVLATPSRAAVAHVGDSRAYRYIAGEKKVVQLTQDHSLLNEYRRANPDMTPEEVANFPEKNVIVRALGIAENVEVDVAPIEFLPGDILLLCCDGLWGMVPERLMAEILSGRVALGIAAEQLIDAANAAGGTDNISCVLVKRCE